MQQFQSGISLALETYVAIQAHHSSILPKALSIDGGIHCSYISFFFFASAAFKCGLPTISFYSLSDICFLFIALESLTPLIRCKCDSCEPLVEALPIDCEGLKFESIALLVQRFKMIFVASLYDFILLNCFCFYSARFRTHFDWFQLAFSHLQKFLNTPDLSSAIVLCSNSSAVRVRVSRCTWALVVAVLVIAPSFLHRRRRCCG